MMNGTPALPRCVACVPTWNAEPFIEETLKALAAQTYPNFEVLISDDASTDGTVAICERFAAADSRFRVIQQTRNLGWVGNVNALLRAAKGEYLFFAFHDDLVEPTYAARLIEQLEANPSAVLAFCDLKTVHVDNESEIGAYEELDGIESRMERARRIILRQGDWWIPNRGIFRADAAKRIGGLKRHLAGEFSADWPWLLHMSLLGGFVRVPELLCCKIYQKQSLSRSWTFGTRAWIAVTLSCAREVVRSGLPVAEKLLLLVLLARRCLSTLLRPLRDPAARRGSDPSARRTRRPAQNDAPSA